MSRLSEEAMWVWEALHEQGLSALEAGELMCTACSQQDATACEPEHLAGPLAELEEAGVVDRRAGDVAGPVLAQSTTGYDEHHGALIRVSVDVFGDVELDLPLDFRGESMLVDDIGMSLESTGRPNPPRTRAALYWCSTADGDEDWFVAAPSALSARLFFEDFEGYDRGDARAEWVADIPDSSAPADDDQTADWPSDELIRRCGGVFENYVPQGDQLDAELREAMGVVTKAVRFGRRIYVAGDVVANTVGRLRPNEGS